MRIRSTRVAPRTPDRDRAAAAEFIGIPPAFPPKYRVLEDEPMLNRQIDRKVQAQRLPFAALLTCFVVGGTACGPVAHEPQSPSSFEGGQPSATRAQEEVKSVVERFLVVAGNWDLEAMRAMIADNANLAIVDTFDGSWTTETALIDQYLDDVQMGTRALGPYYEPVSEYAIRITEDQIAFVWADATLHSFGIPRSRNINNFVLIRDSGEWKVLSVSFASRRYPAGTAAYDLEAFAAGYSQAWSGVRPEFVAMHFAEGGSLRVNDSEPAVGRSAISQVAAGFMTDLPDMVVDMDSVRAVGDRVEFYWTLSGTNSGPGGTGRSVQISGHEEWLIDGDGLIAESNGHFDEAEYRRQLTGGTE